MSDSMDRAQRQETLKGVIRNLHAGQSVADVKETFAELIRDIAPAEIAEMEQNLIAEGIPTMEVKRLCDVHVSVFRESLDAQAATRPETIPGHPIHTLVAENAAAATVLDVLHEALEILEKAPGQGQLAKARQELAHLREYEKHFLRKENLLFPYLEKYDFSGPSTVMWAIHDDIRADWKALDALLMTGPGDDAAKFGSQVDELFARLRTAISEMFYKEENILFPAAMQKLSREEWVELRNQEAEVGYCYVKPGSRWAPAPSLQSDHGELLTLAPFGEIRLDTGSLTAEQINLLLNHLPVEVTFVDENDEVCFFSKSKEALFPRSSAIIGRKVQNCHPPASLHRVQRILDDFRAGRRDTGEFWIHMKGKHIYIRYFALHDEAGNYRGTMEVTQEISRIRELEGERRLLDDA